LGLPRFSPAEREKEWSRNGEGTMEGEGRERVRGWTEEKKSDEKTKQNQ
jgi:hypothetical protein